MTGGHAMKRILLFITVLLLTVALCGCSGQNGASDDPSKAGDVSTKIRLSAHAGEGGVQIHLQDAEVKKGYIRVTALFSLEENTEGSYLPDDVFTVKAYQGDTELTDISDSTGTIKSRSKSVKNDETLGITYDFEISSDKTSFTVVICKNDADSTELARENFKISKGLL